MCEANGGPWPSTLHFGDLTHYRLVQGMILND